MKAYLLVLLGFAAMNATAQQPLTKTLQCPEKDCSLLTGIPQTQGMRSGFVRLKRGESVGEHSTEDHEESLVILHGKGEAKVEDRAVQFASGMLVYIPPRSRHNVTNTGTEALEYVYVVAPIASDKK